MGMIIAVHYDDRADRATAKTSHGFQGEFSILGGLAGPDFQASFEFIQDPRPSANVAGRALADRTDVLSARSQAEGAEERGHSDNIRKRDIQDFRDQPQGFFREVVVLGLDVLKDGDQAFLLALVLIDKGLNLFFFDGQCHFSS